MSSLELQSDLAERMLLQANLPFVADLVFEKDVFAFPEEDIIEIETKC